MVDVGPRVTAMGRRLRTSPVRRRLKRPRVGGPQRSAGPTSVQCRSIPARSACKNTKPRQPFWAGSRQHFMSLWHSITSHLGLQEVGFKPYSLRRGGATSAYRSGVTLDALLTKARWKNTSTARIYLDRGLQALTQLTLPPPRSESAGRGPPLLHSVEPARARGRAYTPRPWLSV